MNRVLCHHSWVIICNTNSEPESTLWVELGVGTEIRGYDSFNNLDVIEQMYTSRAGLCLNINIY